MTSPLTLSSTMPVGPKGALMPLLGLGTWQSKVGEVKAAVIAAIKAGYRHVDAAKIYMNQTEVGNGLKEAMAACNLKREDIWVTSKLWVTEAQPDKVRAACESTLKELGLTYLDQYLIHWPYVGVDTSGGQVPSFQMKPDDSTNYVATWKAMEELYDAGLSRTIGVSNCNKQNLTEILKSCSIKPMTNQVECHPGFNQADLKSFMKEHDIRIVAYCPLGNNSIHTTGISSVLSDPRMTEICQRLGKTAAQVALRWGLQMDHIVIPKSVTEKRIQENAQLYDFTLSDADMKALLSIPQKRQLNPTFFTGKPFFSD